MPSRPRRVQHSLLLSPSSSRALHFGSCATWWKRDVLLPFLNGGALGIPLGAEVLRWGTPAQMRAFVGVALVLFSVYSLARPKLPIVNGGGVSDGAVGVVSGFLGGSTGLAGIPSARVVQARAAGHISAGGGRNLSDDARLVRRKRPSDDGPAPFVSDRPARRALRDVARLQALRQARRSSVSDDHARSSVDFRVDLAAVGHSVPACSFTRPGLNGIRQLALLFCNPCTELAAVHGSVAGTDRPFTALQRFRPVAEAFTPSQRARWHSCS